MVLLLTIAYASAGLYSGYGDSYGYGAYGGYGYGYGSYVPYTYGVGYSPYATSYANTYKVYNY